MGREFKIGWGVYGVYSFLLLGTWWGAVIGSGYEYIFGFVPPVVARVQTYSYVPWSPCVFPTTPSPTRVQLLKGAWTSQP